MKHGLCMITTGGMMHGDYDRGPCVPVVMTVYEYVERSLLGISFIALKTICL